MPCLASDSLKVFIIKVFSMGFFSGEYISVLKRVQRAAGRSARVFQVTLECKFGSALLRMRGPLSSCTAARISVLKKLHLARCAESYSLRLDLLAGNMRPKILRDTNSASLRIEMQRLSQIYFTCNWDVDNLQSHDLNRGALTPRSEGSLCVLKGRPLDTRCPFTRHVTVILFIGSSALEMIVAVIIIYMI